MKRHRLLSFALIFSAVSNFDLSSSESVDRDQCGRTYLGRLGSGVIASHNYPFDYRDNLTCVYRIYLDNRANGSQTTVCLTFRRFSLENSSPFCSFDYVELGSSPPMKYCGTGLWQYGVEKKGNLFSNIWSPNLCWSVQNSDTFDVVFSSDNSINGTGFYATFRVHSSSFTQSVLPSGASDQGPCRLTEWTCFNRKCVAARLLCNGLNDCGDGSDESYAHARCRGQNILACDFSDRSVDGGFCSFDHEGWLQSSEVSRSNGPPGDHTNGSSNGFYIYSEGSSYLVSPQLSLSANTTYCLSFWYFIYGAAPSVSLSVYVSREQAYSRPEWLRHIDETMLSHHKWSLGEVPIYAGSSLQIIFASLPLNNESGTALDDFSITEGSCSGVDISCNFESGFCGWEGTSQLSHSTGTWIADHSWQIQSLERGSLGPKSDHSSNDGSGSYLYAEFLAPIAPNSKAILVSPAISAIPGEVLCLQLWYYAGARAQSFCLLSVMLHHHNNVLGGEIWSQVPSGNDAWKQANVEFEANGPLQVVLLASVKSGNTGIDCGIAVDQLQILRGRCTTVAADLQADSTPQTTNIVCPSATSFLCHTSAFCIPRGWLCDLFNDCGDMSDEGPLAGCPVSGDVPMPHPSTFSAEKNITLDATALPGSRVASTNTPSCEFSCADGFCVFLSQKCDGVSDCTNGHDEMNCSGFYIPPLTFCQKPSMLCVHENHCLSSEFICDGKDDCMDGSDEVGSICSGKFNYGAVAGIIFGCCFSMLFILLIALIARRRRKNCSARQPHRPTRQPAHISTVFSVNNQGGGGGGISRHIDALSAFVARNGDPEHPRDRNRDNMGYIEEANRDLSGRAFPSEMQVMFGDAPPSYSSVLVDNGELGERRQVLLRGNSTDELETQTSNVSAAQDNMANDGQSYEPPAGHSRNRRSYRSLPPTPARQPLVSYLHASNDHQPPTSHRRSMLGYGAVSGHDDGRDHHVYEDPSRAMHRQASRSGSQLSGGPANVPGPDVFHQSSVISPTLSSQRASRIRLGTMALQNRPGVAHHGGQGICSPVCAWQSGLVPDVIGPHSHGHLCFGDQCDAELGSFENADPGHNFALNELVLLDDNGHSMHEQHIYKPNATRMAHGSNSSSCLSSSMHQQNHSGVGRRDAPPGHARTSRRHRNSVENAAGCTDFAWNGLNAGTKSILPVQRREPRYPVACDARHAHGFAVSNHQRSFSSSEFQDNHLSADSAGSYLSNCDDRDLSPQMRV